MASFFLLFCSSEPVRVFESNRRPKSFGYRPMMKIKTLKQSISVCSHFIRPLGHRHGASCVGEQNIVFPVVALIFSVCPSAIVWLVVTIVVDAIKRVPWGCFAHIGKKVFKRLPTLTNLYSALSMSGIARMIRALASHFHGYPNPVNLGVALAVRFGSRHLTKFTAETG